MKTPLIVTLCLGLFLGSIAAAAQKIPETHAQSLADTTVNLPADLKGRIAILVVGFSKQCSSQTREWGDSIVHDFKSDPRVVYYQIPVTAEVPGFLRGFVVDSIRKEVPESERNYFVPIAKDAASWKALTAFSTGDDAYIVVTDSQGQQLWRTHGPPRPDAYHEMKKRIELLEEQSSETQGLANPPKPPA